MNNKKGTFRAARIANAKALGEERIGDIGETERPVWQNLWMQ